MRKLPWLIGAAALGLLSGCGDGQTTANVTTVVETDTNITVPEGKGAASNGSAAAPALQLAPDGLVLAAAHTGFNTSRDAALAALTPAAGEPTGQGTNPECGAGPLENVDFKGGLTLFFQDGKFVGWDVDGRDGSPYKTAGGVGIGSMLQQIRDAGDVAVQDTSLGVEFTASEISGLLTANRPEAKVTNLWAGTTCVFR